MDYVVKQVDSIINPKGSTLIIARDILSKYGVEPPVITDDWWLDVIEYCGNEFPHHEYLWFSIPWKSWNPEDRGVYIGLSALQMLWQQRADEMQISQLTHPSEVLSFIESQPGLKNACMKEPKLAAFYLPQLSIKTFGGFLEPSFDALVKAGTKYQTKHDCEKEVALRHPQFGHYDFTELADIYFAGAGGGFGPSTRRYDLIDCLIWLLSDKSFWLPKEIRSALFTGLTDWGVWDWQEGENSRSDFVSNAATGSLAHALYRAADKEPIKLTKKIQQDIKTRIKHSKSILHLSETVDELVEIFYKKKIIESWIRSKHEMEKRRNRKNS